MPNLSTLDRRHFMSGCAVVAGVALTSSGRAVAQESKPLPAYVDWKRPEAMIVHSNNTLETRREAFGTSLLTPEDKLYIRNNITAPSEAIVKDRDAWEVSIEGVAKPRKLTVGELKQMGLTTVVMVLQCSGNGRAFFDHKPSGTQWQVGAAGCVSWTGVPLKTVVEALGGPAAGAEYVTGTGGETMPAGIDPKTILVERSVPIKALDSIILAWELNGEPISLAHGGPLRMIVPGYTGVNNVKYVKTVNLSEKPSDARIQASRYRMVPLGEKAGPDDPSVWEMEVKSWITSPLTTAKAGEVQITGLAFGGINAIEGVEVSTDGGKTWEKAEFIGPDLGRYAWRPFVLAANLKAGEHLIVSRATDSEGRVQPRDMKPNASGYNHNGWLKHGVTVKVS